MSETIHLGILFAEPLGYEADGEWRIIQRLNFPKEKERLVQSLDEAGRAANVRFAPANADNLLALATLGLRALHYSGHGHPDFLAFEDAQGSAHAVEPALLKKLLQAGSSAPGGQTSLRLAFVSACHSQRAGQAFVEAGVPHVVAVHLDEPVLDEAGREFGRAFYLALLVGKSVRQAFEAGKAQVTGLPGLPGEIEADKFMLLPLDAPHDEMLFADLPAGPWKELTPPLPPARLRALTEHFTGREAELHQVIRQVQQGRMTTIHGPAGIGKTTLAVAAAHYLVERRAFRDGVYFIPLQNTTSAEAARALIASRFELNAPDDETLFSALERREALLLLDNLEDPLNCAALPIRKFLAGLLSNTHRLRLLITSRQPVGALPQAGAKENLCHLERLDRASAARLFFDHAPDAARLVAELRPQIHAAAPSDFWPQFWLRLAHHPALKFLDGHPFAIVLSAALLQYQTLAGLAQEIEAGKTTALRIPGLAEQDRDTSLEVSLSISVEYARRQQPAAVRLFGLLGLLPGGAFPDDVEALWGEQDWRALMDILARQSLVEHSLLPFEYFSTLSVIGSFAESLLSAADFESFALRCAERFAQKSEELYAHFGRDDALFYRALFDLQEANLRACLDARRPARIKKDEEGLSPTAVIATHLPALLQLSDRMEDGLQAAGMGLAVCRHLGEVRGEANVLQALGDLKVRVADLAGARADYDAALPIYRQINARLGEANVLQALGDLKVRVADLAGARADYDAALPIYRQINARLGEANVLQALGDLKVRVADLAGARADYDAALPIYRQINARLGEANVLKALGDLKVRVADLAGARADYDAALPIYRQINARLGEANVLQALGDLKVRVADLAGARADYDAALPIYRQINDRLGEANVLQALGDLKVRVADLAGARADYDAALPIYRQINARLGEANVLKALGDLKVRVADLAGARADYDAALPIYRQINDRLGEANVLKALGDLKVRVDDLAGARADYDAALPIYRQINARLGEANVRQSLGNLALASGDAQKAFDEYRAALAIHQQIQARLGQGADYGYLARAAAAAGEHMQAVVLCEQSLEIYAEIEDRWGQAVVRQWQAEAFWQAEAPMAAIAAWWQARALYRAIGARPQAGQIETIFSQLQAQNASQWAQIEADLLSQAEAIRQQGVQAARQTLEKPGE